MKGTKTKTIRGNYPDRFLKVVKKPTNEMIDAARPLIAAAGVVSQRLQAELAIQVYEVMLLHQPKSMPEHYKFTDKQIQMLRYIHDYRKKFGHAPTMRNISKALGVGLTLTHARVKALRNAGTLKYTQKSGCYHRDTTVKWMPKTEDETS